MQIDFDSKIFESAEMNTLFRVFVTRNGVGFNNVAGDARTTSASGPFGIVWAKCERGSYGRARKTVGRDLGRTCPYTTQSGGDGRELDEDDDDDAAAAADYSRESRRGHRV